MPRPHILAALVALLFCGAVEAREPVLVVDPSAIVIADLGSDPYAIAGMQAAGFDEELTARIIRFSDHTTWPAGWRTDSARTANRALFPNAIAYRLCEYMVEDERLAIVHIPAFENYHMPEGFRSSEDIYFLILADGLAEPPPPPRPKASKGPSWRSMPKARITRPEMVYATYSLGDDPDALKMLEKRGLSQPEIDAVIFRSHERNWPDGIDELDKRRISRKHLKKYKAHMAARWEDKVLLVIPAELNKKMPVGVRPYMDIYMVYTGPAVAVMKK
jgi:hypothetical protein